MLLVWIPLPLGSNRLWSSSLFTLLAVTLLSSWCLMYLLKKARPSTTFKKAWPALVLLVISNIWVAIQAGWVPGLPSASIDPLATRQHFMLGWGLISFFCLALLLLNSQARIRTTLYLLIASGLFQATYGSIMTLSGIEYSFLIPKENYLGVATGTFINRNHFAGYLVMTLSLGLGMMIATLSRTRSGSWRNRLRRLMTALLGTKALIRISLIIMVIGLVLSHSRMGNTSFAAAMLLTGFLSLIINRRPSRSTWLLLASLVVIDVFIVGTFFGIEKVVDRLEQTSSYRETRDEVGTYTLKIVNGHWEKGTGAGSFYTAFPEYRGQDIRLFYSHAHNDYLEFLTERGVIGFIPLLLFVLASFTAALYAQYKRNSRLMHGISFGCIMSILAMGIHATVDFNLQIPANAATFMLVLALSWITLFHPPRKET